MTRSEFMEKVEYFGAVHGVTLRAIAAFSDDDLDFRPQPAMRTVRELIFHIYTQEQIVAEAVQLGSLTSEAMRLSSPESDGVAVKVEAFATVSDLKGYAEKCHQIATGILRALSDKEFARPVESPMGPQPASRCFEFGYDEHWHHRGQLYTYLRLLGKEPPMLYDYQT